MRLNFASFAFILSVSASAQLVSFGPVDRDYCAKQERVRSNLYVGRTTDLRGRIVDASGAPFKVSEVELRTYEDLSHQTTVKKAKTNERGEFELGTIPKGNYRLLASATRAFKQPVMLECLREKCNLEITLQAEPSDQLFSQCPVR